VIESEGKPSWGRPARSAPCQTRLGMKPSPHAYFNAELLQVAHRMSWPEACLATTTKPCDGLSMKTRPSQPPSKADAVPMRPQCGHSSATAHLVGGVSVKDIVVALTELHGIYSRRSAVVTALQNDFAADRADMLALSLCAPRSG
jgi:hypothetical protein